MSLVRTQISEQVGKIAEQVSEIYDKIVISVFLQDQASNSRFSLFKDRFSLCVIISLYFNGFRNCPKSLVSFGVILSAILDLVN